MFKLKNSVLGQLIKTTIGSSLLLFVAILSSAGSTLAAPSNTMPIWRAQVRIVTADVDDAETDSQIRVELKAGNRTWLDSDQDDFERGSDRTYDLRLDGINQLSDLDYFFIGKSGSDGWAIRRIYLIINNRTIYYGDFARVLWLDNSGGRSRDYFLDDSFMRPRAEWTSYVQPVRPSIIPRNDIKSRISILLADYVTINNRAGGNLLLRSPSVELYTLNANTWRVSFNLEEDKQFPFPNVNTDTDFDLRVGCANGRATFSVANLNVSAPWPADGDGAGYFVSNDFPVRLNEMMKNFTFIQCFNVSIVLSPTGDLYFNSIFQPPTGPIFGRFSENELENSSDDSTPLNLHVSAENEIKAFAQTAVTAAVKSNLNEDAEADISFELPRKIVPTSVVIEARDAQTKGAAATRQIAGQFIRRDDGANIIKFRDLLVAGKNTEYTVHVTFQTGDDTVQLTTRVEPVVSTEKVAPLSAVTSFTINSDWIIPQGTKIHRLAKSTDETPHKR